MEQKRPRIVELVAKAIDLQERILASIEGEETPQSVELRLQTQARLEAYQNCLGALHGDTFHLRMDGEELMKLK